MARLLHYGLQIVSSYHEQEMMTEQVTTLWSRTPSLLMTRHCMAWARSCAIVMLLAPLALRCFRKLLTHGGSPSMRVNLKNIWERCDHRGLRCWNRIRPALKVSRLSKKVLGRLVVAFVYSPLAYPDKTWAAVFNTACRFVFKTRLIRMREPLTRDWRSHEMVITSNPPWRFHANGEITTLHWKNTARRSSCCTLGISVCLLPCMYWLDCMLFLLIFGLHVGLCYMFISFTNQNSILVSFQLVSIYKLRDVNSLYRLRSNFYFL